MATVPVTEATDMTDATAQKVYRSARPLISDDEAAIIGPVLEALAEQGRGQPQDIVEAATPEDSPLHRYFTWDDGKAAMKQRLWEARSLARSFRVEIIEVKDEQRTSFTLPGLFSIRYTDGTRSYETLQSIQSDDEKLEQAIADAERRLDYWRKTFAAWRNVQGFAARFEPIFQALEALDEAKS